MRSRRTQLEQDVIQTACDYINQHGLPDAWTSAADLRDAVERLTSYLNDDLNARGAHNGVDTSVAAADMAQPLVGTVRRRILDEIRSTHAINSLNTERPYGLTDEQLELRLRRKHTTISSARNWLVSAGWLEASMWRRDTTSGRKAIVWKLTDKAKQIISSPEWVLTNEGNH